MGYLIIFQVKLVEYPEMEISTKKKKLSFCGPTS